MTRVCIIAVALICWASSAFAYIGPGLGAGVIATVLGILSAFFLALFALVWYPIKRLARKFSKRPKDEQVRGDN